MCIQHSVVVKSADSEPRLTLHPGSTITVLALYRWASYLTSLSVPQFPHLWDDDNNTYPHGIVVKLK